MSYPLEPPTAAPPTPSMPGAATPRRKSSSGGPLTWLIGAVIVLILAVAGGLFTAWVVANMRAVPGPVALVSPSPTTGATSALPSASAGASPGETEGPRRTPTPAPTVELTPAPFVHVVARGESLSYIAGLYQVDIQDVIDLNDIKNANRIQVGQELLIPGYGIQPTPKPRR